MMPIDQMFTGIELDPVSGEIVQKIAASIVGTSTATIDEVKAVTASPKEGMRDPLRDVNTLRSTGRQS